MATYILGDIQGCFEPLQRLLDKIKFDPANDCLWFAGDLVNRGKHSLETLRFIRTLGQSAVSVLGNHDITLIATYYNIIKPHPSLLPLLNAPDVAELISWLRQQPLLHKDNHLTAIMVHAGIPPVWDMDTAEQCARTLETQLQQENPQPWLQAIYGNKPDTWNPQASLLEQQRYSLNALTRMRYCYPDGRLDFTQKTGPDTVHQTHPELVPWFLSAQRKTPLPYTVYFGHWSTLGLLKNQNIVSLDTGCVWGGCLSALRLDTPSQPITQVACTEYT